MSLPESLDEALDDFKTEEVREAFVIDDDQKAGWAMRKLRSLRVKQKANEEIAQAGCRGILWFKCKM
jgi:hypothetical protein